ncbi:MAG TPA: hypothetical protein VL017_11390 [Devosia sp.]|nr:hypothetical protein [Devosia sp.]
MKTILIGLLLAASATSAFAHTGEWITDAWLGTEDVSAGTVCKVKEIVVLAQSAEDCVTIGGEATHTLTQSAEPITK